MIFTSLITKTQGAQDMADNKPNTFDTSQGKKVSPEELRAITRSTRNKKGTKGRPSYEDTIEEHVRPNDGSGKLKFTHNGSPDDIKPDPQVKLNKQRIPKTKPRGAGRYRYITANRNSPESTVSSQIEGHMDISSKQARRGRMLRGWLQQVTDLSTLSPAIIQELIQHGLLNTEGKRIE